MSAMAIADYFIEECKIKRADIDIAIPFIHGCFRNVTLYVMRIQGEGRPKIQRVTGTEF